MQVQPWDGDLSTADLKITLCTKFNVRLGMHDMVTCTYCTSRIFRMHVFSSISYAAASVRK